MDRREFRPRHHASLERIVRFDLLLTCRTGLHIGAGKSSDLAGSDLPVLRDASGRPLVPGSSLRGILRSGIESFCHSLGLAGEAIDPGEETYGLPTAVVTAWRGLTLDQRLFGVAADAPGGFSYASRLQLSDGICDTPISIELRDGVGINRDSRIAANAVKFDLEVVPAGTCFRSTVRFKNPADFELGLLAQALWMLDAGLLLLGGKSARGLGWIGVKVTSPRVLDAKAILSRSSTEEGPETAGPVEVMLGEYLAILQRFADSVAATAS